MPARARRMTAREVEGVLRRYGFRQVSQKGSHRKWRHPQSGLQVIVPEHRGRQLPQSPKPNGRSNMTAEVYHADLWGLREVCEKDAQGNAQLVAGKYHWLYENDLSTTKWATVEPDRPFYLFVPQDIRLREEYEQGWKVTDAMPVNVLGFQTHRDRFAIDFERDALRKRIEEMRDDRITDHEYAQKHDLKDNRDWHLAAHPTPLPQAGEGEFGSTTSSISTVCRRKCGSSTSAATRSARSGSRAVRAAN